MRPAQKQKPKVRSLAYTAKLGTIRHKTIKDYKRIKFSTSKNYDYMHE